MSEENKFNEALRASEERFRQLAENIQEVFWMTNADKTQMLYVSPRYEVIWGRTCESLCDAPSSWLDAIHPADRARVESALPTQRVATWEATYRIVRPDGSERWIRDRSFPVLGDDGRTARIVGIAEDISQLVVTEERLRQSQKLEAIGQLAGGIAHDFNNFLSVILSYTDLLLGEPDLQDPLREQLDEVLMAGQRAADLTRQLLALGHKHQLQPRPTDLRETLASIERMLRRIVPGHIDVLIEHPPSLGTVHADPGQLQQVILNLAVNARDAMPDGGTLTIETADVSIGRVDANELGLQPGAYVVLSVSDDGVGMDPETRARIFEPFFTTKGPGKGTGLGLSSVLAIVQRSGGAIRVVTAPGQGASFQIHLPLVGHARAPSPTTATPSPVSGGTETILLAEHDEQVRVLARMTLRRAGYRVVEAASAGDALLICEQHSGTIHLLLTDVGLPRLAGPELAARVRAARPFIEVMYMSGYRSPPIANNGALERGAFMQKPITPDTLSRMVREVLDRARAPGRGETTQ